jgi:hypothetical protein
VPTAVPQVAKGDGDCDGDIDLEDTLKTLQYVGGIPYSQNSGCPKLGSAAVAAAGSVPLFGDADCDGDVDGIDALWILRHVAVTPLDPPQDCTALGS